MSIEERFEQSVYEVTDAPMTEEIPTITEGQVEYYLRKISKIQNSEEEINKIAKNEIGKIQAWMASELKTLESKKQWYENALQVFATEKLKDSDKKSLSYPSGRFGFTKQAPEFFVNDENLLAFAKANCPEFIKVTEKVEWGALKKTLTLANDNKLVTDDGQVVDGVTYQNRPDKFNVKVV